MKVKITQSFYKFGLRHGVPCVSISNDDDAEERTINEVVSAVLEYKGIVDLYCFDARLTEDKDMVMLVRTLADSGMKLLVATDSTDDVSSMAFMKNIAFSIAFVFPSEEKNSMNHASMNSLRERDEILVMTEDKDELDFAIRALKAKLFTRPEIVFFVPEEMNSIIMKNKFTCAVRVINF